MARSRKGKLFNLFKEHFKITFYYKPSGVEDDIFHYIILDDILKLKIKVVRGTLVIDDIIPLSTSYMAKIYDTLIELLVNQTEFTILVSLTGNTSAFSSSCIKCGAPVIEDPRFICVPENLYKNLKEYYNDDESKYGFYLLAVRDASDDEVIDENTIEAGKIPLIDKIMKRFEEEYKADFKITMEYDNWKFGKMINVRGIKFRLTFNAETNQVGLHNFDLYEMRSYFDLILLCNILEDYWKRGDIILHEVDSPQINGICIARGYVNIEENQTKMLSFNQRYTNGSFGSYKISK